MARSVSEVIREIDGFLSSTKTKNYRFVLAAVKGLRNGAVYGAKVRFPHALVMTFLFGKGSLVGKARTILELTRTHSTNLAKFVFSYKLGTGAMAYAQKSRPQWHSALVAAVVGYFVFGDYNGVNMQINLYLLSRITVAFARLAVEKGVISQPPVPVFPLFAAGVWGAVLWLFEYHKHNLQPSLQNSMTYLYHDSNFWTCLRDLLWVNKL